MKGKRKTSHSSSWNGALRRQAEGRLGKTKDENSGTSPPSLEELVHELRVQREELIIQNDELQQAQRNLADARDRFQDLYDSAPTGYFTLDRRHQILDANLSGANLLGTAKGILLNSKFSSFVAPTTQNQDLFYFHLLKAERSGQPQECDIEMRKPDGTQFFAHLNTLPVMGRERNKLEFRISMNDATAHRETGLKFEQSEENYQHLFETMAQGVIYQDGTGQVTSANGAAEQILGLTREQIQERLSGSHHSEAIHEDGSLFEADLHPSAVALRTGKAMKEIIMGFYNPREKSVRWTSVCAIPQFKPGETLPFRTYITLTDITEMKRIKDDLEVRVKERTKEIAQANEKLKAYARDIVRIQEEERKRIAYELHDDTVQYLAILKLQIESLLKSEKIQLPDIQRKLSRLGEDANRAIRDIRRYSHELRPTVLDHMGLAAALEQMAEDNKQTGDLRIKLKVQGEEKEFSDEVKLAVFRIAQEAINNARKHAKANLAEINLMVCSEKLILTVIDDGQGFNLKQEMTKAAKRGSLGLSSMQERAELIGATLKIRSQIGRGTRVAVTVPLQPRNS